VPRFARDIAGLCDGLGLTGVHVVGLSMGGMMAFQLAVERPELVRSLVIINSGPELVARTPRRKLELGLRLALLKLLGPAVLARVLAPRLFPKPEQEALRQRALEVFGANEPDAYLRATKGLVRSQPMKRNAVACSRTWLPLLAVLTLTAAAPARAGTWVHGIEGTRGFQRWVPTGYQPDTPLPLVVALHGCFQSPSQFAGLTRLNEKADAERFLVLYPNQATFANPTQCWNFMLVLNQTRGHGEPALIVRMVEQVRRHYVEDSVYGGALVARHIEIQGMDHAWPGGDSRHPFADPSGPDATALMWDFFRQHTRD